MPLNTPLWFVDKDQKIHAGDVGVKVREKPSGYAPTPQYYPTMKIVKCTGCLGVGILEFVNGFSLKDGDNLMEGRPVKGVCVRCNRETEMVPIKVSDKDKKQLGLVYGIQQSLDEAVRRGERMSPSAMIWPLARVKKYEEYARRTTERTAPTAAPTA